VIEAEPDERASALGQPRHAAVLSSLLAPVVVASVVQALCSAALGSRALLVPLRSVELGASRGEVGLVFAAWTATAAFASIPSAAAIERWGLRRSLGAAFALYLLSQTIPGLFDQFWVLVLSMVLGGVAAALAQNGLMAWITSAQRPGAVARSMGWYTLAMQLGNTLGPAVAGVLLTWLSTKQTFLVTAAVLLPTFGFLLLAPTARRGGGQAAFTGRMLELLRAPGILAIVAVFLMTGTAWGIFQSYYALFGTRGLGLTTSAVGFLIGLSAIVGAISRIPAGRLLARLQGREPQALMVATTGVGLTLILLPHAGGLVGAGLVAIAFSPLVSVGQLAAAVALTSRAGPETKSSALSIYTLVFNLGWGAGVVAFSPFMQAGYLPGFTASGTACALVGVAALAASRLRSRSEVEAFPAGSEAGTGR